MTLILLLLFASPQVPAQWLTEGRPKALTRVVTVAPSLTELLFALGVGDRVVGVSRYDDRPESVKKLPKVGGFLDPNVEAILGLRPDLVLAVPSAGNRSTLQRVADLGVPVFVVPGNSFADVFTAIRAVSPLFGKKAEGDALERRIRDELARLAKRTASGPKVKALVVYGWNPLSVAGPGSFADTIMSQLNAMNVVDKGTPYMSWSAEQLVAAQPDVIIDAAGSMGALAGSKPWTRFTAVPAVKNDRVHSVELTGLLRPGPSITEGMRALAKLLHPGKVDPKD